MSKVALQCTLCSYILCLIIVAMLLSMHVHKVGRGQQSTRNAAQAATTRQLYIFGYGSLINSESRKETGITGEATPVRVHHMSRGWIYDVDTLHHPTLSNTPFTAVGVEKDMDDDQSTVNGVIFALDGAQLPKYDAREARYVRENIDHHDIEVLRVGLRVGREYPFLEPDAVVYVYVVPDEIALREAERRVLKQSYIDKFISGCLEMGREFAEECVESTRGWNGAYQDDREQSTFSKDKIDRNVRTQIDDLLENRVPLLK